MSAVFPWVRVRLVGEARATAKAAGREGGEHSDRIFSRNRGAVVPVAVADIVRAEATSGGVALSTRSGLLDLDASRGELESRLDPSDFVRVHRAHLVNLAHVVSIRRYDERRLSVRTDDGETVVASRGGSQLLRDLMG